MMKRMMMCLLAVLFLAVLSGCDFELIRPMDELYTAPHLPQEYQELDEAVQSMMSELNAGIVTPLSGSNTTAVQLLDLDGDGEEESAAAFFRVTDSEDLDDLQPMRVVLFRKDSEGNYEVSYVLVGEGNDVNSVAYEDLNGNGVKEVIVSWQLTAQAYVLVVYSLSRSDSSELMRTTYNESYVLADMNGDGFKDLVVIQRDDTGEDAGRAYFYTFQENTLTVNSAPSLSENIVDVVSVRTGVLDGQVPAVYVTSDCTGGQVTDILAYLDDGLVNITKNQETGISSDTMREYTSVSVMDINQDGVLDIPVSMRLPGVEEGTQGAWLTYWRQFDAEGNSTVVCITYHAVSDGWYLVLPNDWDGQIAIETDDRENYRGERSVIFYHRSSEEDTMERFMTIYRLSGNTAVARATLGSRELLLSPDSSTAYSVEFAKDGWDCGLDADQVAARFSLITQEWSSSVS